MTYTSTQRAAQAIAALVFIVAGLGHFLFSEALARFIPPYIPAPVALVLISGGFEIAGGVGLFLPRSRRWAAWGLSALLVSFLPANLFMATHPTDAGFPGIPIAVLWGRIALLPVMVWSLLWCTRPAAQTS